MMVASALVIQRDARFQLVHLAADQAREVTRAVDHGLRAVDHHELAQARERGVDLGHRRAIRLEVARIAGEEVAALAGLGVGDERERLVHGGFHLEGSAHGAVRELETSIAKLGEAENRKRHDHAEHERQHDAKWKKALDR
jgi:hypothetical protein